MLLPFYFFFWLLAGQPAVSATNLLWFVLLIVCFVLDVILVFRSRFNKPI